MTKANVCIVIPLYKVRPTELELKVINQGREIFKERDIFYVVPRGFDASAYAPEALVEFPEYYFYSLSVEFRMKKPVPPVSLNFYA